MNGQTERAHLGTHDDITIELERLYEKLKWADSSDLKVCEVQIKVLNAARANIESKAKHTVQKEDASIVFAETSEPFRLVNVG